MHKLTEILREPPGCDAELNRSGPADRAIGIEQPGKQCAALPLRGTQIQRRNMLVA
jgi:hypothetical protein